MTSILKNVYINKLGDIVNEYNKTYNRTIKIKPLDVKDKDVWLIKELIINILNFKLVIMLAYQNAKNI